MRTFADVVQPQLPGASGPSPLAPAAPSPGLSTRTKLLIGGGAVVGLGLLLWFNRKAVGNVVSSAQVAAVKLLMPKGTEYIADLAFELAPKYDVSPFTILGITYAESGFGLARGMEPKGPSGTGDRIPRPAGSADDAILSKLPGVERRVVDGIPARRITGPVDAWVPTTRGWGHGLYQLDWKSFYKYLSASNDWADPRKAMEKALELYRANKTAIAKAVPNIGTLDLLKATVASYNAGAGRVIDALKAGIPADQLDKGPARKDGGTRVTFGEGYVDHILGKASTFAKTA